ncbi:hypothetical protein ACFLSJ_02170, partial [Verrucomicrobiota bacterium]
MVQNGMGDGGQGGSHARRLDAAAFGLFCGLAVLVTAPGLFSGGERVCAEDAPDTWIHMWAFWRTKFALLGHDHGYLTSHVLTYPGYLREPIAVFDPLLPLMSVPLQLLSLRVSTAFNLLTAAGLAFSAMCGYALTAHLSGRRSAGIVGGVVTAFNPFIYRQITGGYIEYAWWGILPLTTLLWLKSVSAPGLRPTLRYAVALLVMLLHSIYCAACFVVAAAATMLAEAIPRPRGEPRRLGQMIRVQAVVFVLLLPLLAFWLCNLSALGFKGLTWKTPFTSPDSAGHEKHTGRAPLFVERTVAGSLDIADLLSLTSRGEDSAGGRWDRGEGFRSPFEVVRLGQWLPVLLLAGLAFRNAPMRRANLGWLALSLGFLVTALGPFPVWRGEIASGVVLPYAWLHQWVPGFSRLII